MFYSYFYTVWNYVAFSESINKKYYEITLGSSEIEKHVGGTLLNSLFWGGEGASLDQKPDPKK